MAALPARFPSALRLCLVGLALLVGCGEGTDGGSADAGAADVAVDVPADVAGPVRGYVACPVDPTAVGSRPEHPRPDFCRPQWRNLNGPWRFAFDPSDEGLDAAWFASTAEHLDREITVPFPWQSALSGIGDTAREGVAWYARTVELPPEWTEASAAGRVELVFGAVDWEAQVWVNGQGPWTHEGGYTPFRVDATDALVDGPNEIVVRAFDPGADPEYPHGKQGVPWYTNVGGIWQTVYLERTPELRITKLRFFQAPLGTTVDVPPADELTLHVDVAGVGTSDPLDGPVVELWRDGDTAPLPATATFEPTGDGEGRGRLALTIPTDETWRWSPDEPNLVPLTVHVCPSRQSEDCDTVSTWAATRSVARAALSGADGAGADGNQLIHLNGEPVYVRGVLVQGYHPDGLMTYPDEATIIADLEAAKEAGFNLVRLHIKPEEPLLLHHADRLGLLVDYDMVCLGAFPFAAGDTEAGRKRWVDTAREQIARDANHPSVVWWTLFNETWGLIDGQRAYDDERQAWVLEQLDEARTLLPDALIEDMSPTAANRDHVETDLVTWHFYGGDPAYIRAHLDEVVDNVGAGSGWLYTGDYVQLEAFPLLNTEFGPFSIEPFAPEWLRDRDISDDLRWLLTELRSRPAISGYVFTELYDVEFEHNGLNDYDRGPKETGLEELMGCSVASLQGAVFVGQEEGPTLSATPGASVTLHPWVSTYEPARVGAELEWSLWTTAGDGPLLEGRLDLDGIAAGRTDLAPVTVQLPTVHFPSQDGAYLWRTRVGDACNVLPIIALPPRDPSWRETADGWAQTIAPSDFTAAGEDDSFEEDVVESAAGAPEGMGFLGAGRLETTVTLPPELLEATAWTALRLTWEGAANQRGMPQTDTEPFPSEVRVLVDDVELGTVAYGDDWADARGVLSHHTLAHDVPSGGYGVLETVAAPAETLAALRETAADGELRLTFAVDGEGGLMLYGAHTGRFPQDPTLVITPAP